MGATVSHPSHRVFVNFRGKDVRYSFVSHLLDALQRQNIKFFVDTHEQKGRNLNHLFKRIEHATISLVILSKRYGESKWCLEELRTIMEESEKSGMIVIPIFYRVRPGDVRNQKGVFGDRFRRRTDKSSPEDIEKWQMALKAVSNKIGFTLDHKRSEADLIKNVVREIENVLSTIQSDEGREVDFWNKVKTYNVPVLVTLLPWTMFGSVVWLIGAVLGLLTDTIQKCFTLAMFNLAGQFGSFLATSCRWTDESF